MSLKESKEERRISINTKSQFKSPTKHYTKVQIQSKSFEELNIIILNDKAVAKEFNPNPNLELIMDKIYPTNEKEDNSFLDKDGRGIDLKSLVFILDELWQVEKEL